MVAVTVQEDSYGNLVVTKVNGADAAQLNADIYKNQNITLNGTDADKPGNRTLPKSADADYEAHSTIGAGTLYNTYQASGKATVSATKVLNSGTLVDNMFYFELVQLDKSGNEVRVINEKPNKAGGSITFDSIIYNLAQVRKDAEGTSPLCDGPNTENEDATENEWTYKYLIRELVPADDTKAEGVTYDTSEYYVLVTVSDADGDGTLDTTVKYYSDNSYVDAKEITAANVKFTNAMATKATISAIKDIEGISWDDTMNFWFQIAAVGGKDKTGATIAASDVPMPTIVRKAATNDSQTVTWEINIGAGKEGYTYNYTIKEI